MTRQFNITKHITHFKRLIVDFNFIMAWIIGVFYDSIKFKETVYHTRWKWMVIDLFIMVHFSQIKTEFKWHNEDKQVLRRYRTNNKNMGLE